MAAPTTSRCRFSEPGKGARKINKLTQHYFPQLGAMIHVTCQRHADPDQEWEDHAACSAAVQNILLAAEARGLAKGRAHMPCGIH